jgi:5-(aminomethyl)-3-furanmethanol phosphate kinase
VTRTGAEISVIKVGGGLTAVPGALERVCTAVAEVARHHRVLVIPGGGPFADTVRKLQTGLGVSEDAAHWMAILAMDQYACVLAEKISGCILLEEPGEVSEISAGRPGILAPSRWMRSADVLPHTWDVTSDSIAAFVAGALDAVQLILVKPTAAGDALDSYFPSALPSDLPYHLLGAEEIDQLALRLNAPSAAGGRA